MPAVGTPRSADQALLGQAFEPHLAGRPEEADAAYAEYPQSDANDADELTNAAVLAMQAVWCSHGFAPVTSSALAR